MIHALLTIAWWPFIGGLIMAVTAVGLAWILGGRQR